MFWTAQLGSKPSLCVHEFLQWATGAVLFIITLQICVPWGSELWCRLCPTFCVNRLTTHGDPLGSSFSGFGIDNAAFSVQFVCCVTITTCALDLCWTTRQRRCLLQWPPQRSRLQFETSPSDVTASGRTHVGPGLLIYSNYSEAAAKGCCSGRVWSWKRQHVRSHVLNVDDKQSDESEYESRV